MTPPERAKLTAHFDWVPWETETLDVYITRMENLAGSDKDKRKKLSTFHTLNNAGQFFQQGLSAAEAESLPASVRDLVGLSAKDAYYGQQGGQGVQQTWLTTKEAAYKAAAESLGNRGTGRSFSDPDNLSANEKKALDAQFNIYAQQGRWTYESRAATVTGPYTSQIVGSGEGRMVVLSQGGVRVATRPLGAEFKDYTEDELNVVRQDITGSDERFVLVQARGKTIAQWRESTLDEIGEESFEAAWEKGGKEGIPEDRRDVKTSIAPDGSTRYFPAIKPAGAPEADIGTTATAETTFINLGEGQGELLLYKTGNQVGSIRIPPEPGVTIQNTFRTPGGGVRAVFSDGSEQVYGEADFTLGTPTQRVGPNGQMDWYIETAPGQYSQIPETFKPDVVRIGDREFVQNTKGDLAPLPREFDPGLTQIGGRTIMQQPKGEISELDRLFEPGIITRDGVQLIQQPKGEVSQTRAANINEIIAQALIDGNFDKALAFQDFANRPSAKEAFDAALSFARSPADQQLVSSIARGETPVAPPPPGVVQRIGPQPDFLVQAYNEFQQRLRGGRPPTPEEQEQYASRYRSGETPVSDELRLKMKTQEDANARAMEKNEQAMAALEQKRETDQRNFDLQLQKQDQDFEVKLAQVTGNFQRVGQERTATGQQTVDDAYAAAGGDPTVAANQAAVNAMSTGDNTKLSPTELIEKGLAAKEEVFKEQFSDLNRDLSKGAAGIGPWAGLVTAAELSEWALTAAKNAGASSSPYQQAFYESFAGLANERWKREGGEAKDIEAKRLADLESAEGTTQVGGVGDVVSTDYLKDKRAAQFAKQRAGWGTSTIPDLFESDDTSSSLSPDTVVSEPSDLERATEAASSMVSSTGEVGFDPGEVGFAPPSADDYPQEIGQSFQDWVADFDASLSAKGFAKGGMTSGKNLEIVGEEGPELVDLPPGTFVLPLKNLNQRQLRQAQKKGIPGYQSGGIVFQDLPLGLRQQQAGRAIPPPRGYRSRAAGLTLPSAQAFQNITPESREVFFDVAKQAGIPQGAFAQELRTAFPGGQRLPVSRNYPLRFRGVR